MIFKKHRFDLIHNRALTCIYLVSAALPAFLVSLDIARPQLNPDLLVGVLDIDALDLELASNHWNLGLGQLPLGFLVEDDCSQKLLGES